MQLGVVCGRSARHFVVRTRSAMPTYGLGTRGPSPPLPGVTRAGDDPAADSPPSSPTAASVYADGFFDAREAETPTKGRLPFSSPDPLEAWELVFQDGRAVPAPAGDPVLDPLLDFLARCPPVRERGVSPHPCPRCTVELEPRPRQRADAGSRRRGRPASRSTRLPSEQVDAAGYPLLPGPTPGRAAEGAQRAGRRGGFSSFVLLLRGPVGSSACSGVAARRRAVARRLGATARRAARCGAASPPPLSSSAVARCGAGRGRRRWRRGLRLRPFRGLCSKPLETLAVMHVLGRSINIQRLR